MEGCVGEESFQMWELNRRLEAYLTRVKTLEEQNQLLSAELGGLRAQSGDTSWRARADDELAALRVLVDQRWREKHAAEVQRDNLAEELEGVAGRCQQVRLARERTCEEAACSRRALEAEKSARGWLSAQAAELERELEALRAAHDEERAHLNAQAACAARRSPAPPRGPPARAPEVEELAKRLGEAWRGAVRDYQERVAHMESSLGQARERLGRAVRGAREGRLELQQLQAERDSLQGRREALEQRLEGRWQDRLQATEKFQLAVEALEQEKQGLQGQIAQILEGGQQLAHLKMSLSLEVATYRTLLEAENSRLQTPGRSSQASRGFLDPKLKLHFLGTPEDQHLGSVLPVLSLTALPSPLPNALETPGAAFLKTQEFLQAQTPTLASTPISPMSEALCPANAEARAQGVPASLLQAQGERQQAPEPLWAEATVPLSTSVLPELEEPGGKQPGHFPEDPSSLAPSLNPHHPILEAKDGGSSRLRVSSTFQEDEGQVWELVEKETAIEVEKESSLGQETQEGGPYAEEIQDSQSPLQKETLEAVGEEPLMCQEIQSCETPVKENCNSLRSIEENLETLKSPEKEKQTLQKSLEEKDAEAEQTLEGEIPELSKPLEEDDPRIMDQELMSPEGTLETVSFLGKKNQEAIGFSEEGHSESSTFKNESQYPLGCPDAEGQESLRSPQEEDQEAFRLLEKENQEPLRLEEAGNQMIERLVEQEGQESLRSPEEQDQRTVKPLERENPESLRSLDENQETILPLESTNQRPLRSLEEEEEEQRTVNALEKVSQDSLRSPKKESVEPLRPLEEDDQVIENLLEKEAHKSLGSLEDKNLEPIRLPEYEATDSLRSLAEEDQRIVKQLEEENPELPRSLEEEEQVTERSLDGENQEPLSSVEKKDQMIENLLEKESQDSVQSLEGESQAAFRPLGKENPESPRLLEGQDQEIQRLEQETQQTLRDEGVDQMAVSPPNKVDPELLKPLGKDENLESLVSLKGRSVEPARPSEAENAEPKDAQDGLEMTNSADAYEPLWSTEVTRETARPLENEIRASLGYVGENPEPPRPLERENQELRSLDKWDPETVESPEGTERSRQHLEEEGCLETEEHQESPRSPGEVGQEPPGSGKQQRGGDVAAEKGAVGQDPPLGRTGVESEDEAELCLRGQGGKEEAAGERKPQQDVVMGEAWSLESSEPKERRVPAEEGSRVGNAEDLEGQPEQMGALEGQPEQMGALEGQPEQMGALEGQPAQMGALEGQPEQMGALEGQPEQMGALEGPVAQGMPEVAEQDEDTAQAGEQDSAEVTLGLEAAATRAGLEMEPEMVGLGDPRHVASEEEVIHPSLGEESVKAKIAQGLEGPGKEPKEAGALESEILDLPKTNRDALEHKGSKESEHVVSWGAEEASVQSSDHEGSEAPQPRPPETEEDEGGQAAPTPPGLKVMELRSPIPIMKDAEELQLQGEGTQEAGWQLEGGSDALGRVDDEQELGLGEIPEGLQDWEENREESEGDDLGETLPDSTPLGLYLRSPTSPKWDLAREQRLSPQGEARNEGWEPAVLAAQGLSNPPEEEEEEEEEEEGEQGQDSDLSSEEFEDLGTEASLLPGSPKEAADHLGQVPPVLEPSCWDQGGESDGFADEEESGEEGEAESGTQWWGPGASGGGFRVQDITQRGDLEHDSVSASGPWGDGLRGAATNVSVTALESVSQDSAEPSGSEGSESVSLEGEGQVPDHLDDPQEVTGMVPGAGDTLDVSGQGPYLESGHMNGKIEDGLGQPEGQRVLDGDQDRGLPLQGQEVATLKAPLVGSPVHPGPSQSLEGVDGESWSSGED